MDHRPFKDGRKTPGARGESQTDTVERRSSARKPVIATAQVVELNSGARLRARSCDLVVQGCYIDTLNPFPANTLVRIRLEKENAVVDAKGKVVYRLPGLGMGIEFINLAPENQRIVEHWLASSGTTEDVFEASLARAESDDSLSASLDPSGQFSELVTLLQRKGLITRTEAATLLKQPLD